MTRYPISVPFDRYSGRDPRKLKKAEDFNRIAARVEEYINNEGAKWPADWPGTFFSHEVAAAIREDDKLVQIIIARIDGGSNGVTIFKGDYERAMMPKPRSAQ